MKKLVITKQAVYAVLREYWQEYKAKPWHTLGCFIFPVLGTIFVSYIPPLIVGRLVSIFAEQGTIALGSVGSQIALFGGVWLFGEICWRAGTHSLIQLEMSGIRSLSNKAFARLAERDYNFFGVKAISRC